MENQHHDDHNYRHDHTEEEFSTANPNTNEPEQPIAPNYSEKENQRLDTDPNRYKNFPKPHEEAIIQEGSATDDNSHYSTEDDRIQQPFTTPHQNSPEEESEAQRESKPRDYPELDKSQSEFFEGL
ncbi:MAG TPA: hypothetical protein PLS51_02950 [Flavobacterium sp.]|jgi:hypothetical protein|nr:hypothetical protein [Flavobacterium sp.]HPJ09561.1 hypothetical protein [Flavobacterium sp.]